MRLAVCDWQFAAYAIVRSRVDEVRVSPRWIRLIELRAEQMTKKQTPTSPCRGGRSR